MKAYLSLSIFIILLFACKSPDFVPAAYQSFNIKPEQKDSSMCFENVTVKICYDFWKEGGGIHFVITNLTDSVLIWRIDESHLIFNGITYDLYRNVTQSANSDTSVNIALYKGGGHTNLTTSTQNKERISLSEPPIVRLLPNSSREFVMYSFTDSYYNFTNGDIYQQAFTKDTSPFKFSVSISYNFQGQIPYISTQNFYVDNIALINGYIEKSTPTASKFYITTIQKFLDKKGKCMYGNCQYKYEGGLPCPSCALKGKKYCETHLK